MKAATKTRLLQAAAIVLGAAALGLAVLAFVLIKGGAYPPSGEGSLGHVGMVVAGIVAGFLGIFFGGLVLVCRSHIKRIGQDGPDQRAAGMPPCRIRSAQRDDSRRIAELYRISSDGVADYIWTKLAQPGEAILDVGQRRYAREGTPFSYQNCRLVEHAGAVIGMLVAFPMKVDAGHVETDPVLVPYSVLEEDQSYYICGMAVEEEHRGKGIGTTLLQEAERSARQQGYDRLSLIVFEQNAGALRLYSRHGFAETRRHPVVPHPLIHYTGDALLMVKQLGAPG